MINLSNLNNQQIEAINNITNTTLVVAGAGSGKTTVLTKRIEKLIIEEHCKCEEILAITFTNKAVSELKERLHTILGSDSKRCTIMTFHGISYKIIRENTKYLKYHDQKLTIIDTEDKNKILKEILKSNNLNEIYTAKKVGGKISYAKSISIEYDDVIKNIEYELSDVVKQYEKYLQENNLMDFDDLLLYAYNLLTVKEVQKHYQNKFKYISVDEYQDTSHLQSKMLKFLKSKENNIFLVGDIDQCIYEWRGATIKNIMKFESEFENCKIIKLEQNYRSTNNILTAANNLIENNQMRYEKVLKTERSNGAKIKYKSFVANELEAEFIVGEIKKEIEYCKMVKKELHLSEIALLYRYNYQSKYLEDELIKENISYEMYGGMKFYERMEIKDFLAYIRLALNFDDNIAFLRVINVPKRKVGDVTLSKIIKYAKENDISYFLAAKELATTEIKKFIKIVEEFSSNLDNFKSAFEKLIIDLEYEKYLLNSEEEKKVEERMTNIEELKYSLIKLINTKEDLSEHINELCLFSEENQEEENKVILSTIHGVKGCEYNHVYMIGLNEGKFPKGLDYQTKEQLEEERRVAYVGITRARYKLTLTSVDYDFKGYELERSRFLEEMDVENTTELEGFIL